MVFTIYQLNKPTQLGFYCASYKAHQAHCLRWKVLKIQYFFLYKNSILFFFLVLLFFSTKNSKQYDWEGKKNHEESKTFCSSFLGRDLFNSFSGQVKVSHCFVGWGKNFSGGRVRRGQQWAFLHTNPVRQLLV